MPAKTKLSFHPGIGLGGEALAALSPSVAHHADATARTHPAQEPMHPAAVSFLGLEGPFDRGSVPDRIPATRDTGRVASSGRAMPCSPPGPVLHSPAGSSFINGWGRHIQVRIE